MSDKSPLVVLLAVVLSSLILSGCGTFRMYSEAHDKQGAAAKKAWEDVDLKEIVTTERGNLKKLLEAELETQDRLTAGIRNYTLRNQRGQDRILNDESPARDAGQGELGL